MYGQDILADISSNLTPITQVSEVNGFNNGCKASFTMMMIIMIHKKGNTNNV